MKSDLLVKDYEEVVVLVDDNFISSDGPLTIMQLCSDNDMQLPRFCYHPDLGIAGNCRICLVEEEAEDKMILACSTIIEEGDIIHTTSDRILEARESVLEYLLINHPLDCPICDRGGECDLQDQALLFGSDRGRFYESTKRAIENKNYSTLIKFSLNRCIQCSRCTRFLSDVSGSNSIFLMGRGLNTEITSYVSTYISDEFSGNIIDLCPVGALTSKSLAYTLRFWEVIDIRAFDIFDVFLTPIKVEFRGSDIMRILPTSSAFSNEYWITDKVRFNFDGYTKQRLLQPMFISQHRIMYSTYEECFNFYKKFLITSYSFLHYKDITSIGGYNALGDFIYLEDALSLNDFGGLMGNTSFLSKKLINSCYDFRSDIYSEADSDLNYYKDFFLINTNLRLESPVFNLKLKEHISENVCFIYSLGSFNYNYLDLDEFGGNNIFNYAGFITENLCHNALFINSIGDNWFGGYIKVWLNFVKSLFSTLSIHVWNSFYSFTYLNLFETGAINIRTINNGLSMRNAIDFGLINSVDYNNSLPIGGNSISKYILRIFFGTHGDYGAQSSNIIVPATIFLERPYSAVNIRGVVYSYRVSAYKYFIEDVRSLFDSIRILLMKLGSYKTFLGGNNIPTRLYSLKYMYKALGTDFLLFNKVQTSNKLIRGNNNYIYFMIPFALDKFFSRSFLFNFFLSDHYSRASVTLSTHYSKSFIFSDFKFIFNL